MTPGEEIKRQMWRLEQCWLKDKAALQSALEVLQRDCQHPLPHTYQQGGTGSDNWTMCNRCLGDVDQLSHERRKREQKTTNSNKD